MAKEKCLNCGCGIGDLETPYVWNERVVCRSCFKKLQPKSWKNKWMVLATAIGTVGIIAFLIVRSVGPKPPAGEDSSSTTLGSQDVASPRTVAPVVPSTVDIVPAKAQISPTNDSLAVELARTAAENERLKERVATLETENERLRQQTAIALTSAPPPASIQAPLKLGSLSGSAWLTTNGGASNLMRGLNVAVLTPTIDSRPIVATALAGIPGLRKSIDECDSRIADQKKLNADINDAGDTDVYHPIRDLEDEIRGYQARIGASRNWRATHRRHSTSDRHIHFLRMGWTPGIMRLMPFRTSHLLESLLSRVPKLTWMENTRLRISHRGITTFTLFSVRLRWE